MSAIDQAIADLDFIVEREDFTFAECSVAEEIVRRAKSARSLIAQMQAAEKVQSAPLLMLTLGEVVAALAADGSQWWSNDEAIAIQRAFAAANNLTVKD